MLAVLDDADWCDIHGSPIRRRRKGSSSTLLKARIKRTSYFLIRFGILAYTFFYCIGSQFLTLRRLTVAELETNDRIEIGTNTEIDLLKRNSPHFGNEHQHGTSLLGRIQTESMMANTAVGGMKSSHQTATHTRKLGPAANNRNNYNMGKWPILQTHTTSANTDSARQAMSVSNARTVRNSSSNMHHNNENNIATRAGNSRTVKRNSNIPRTRISETIPDSNGVVTTTASATRTRKTRFTSSRVSAMRSKSRERTLLGKYKIVGFTDYNYRDIAVKWFERLENLGYHEHILVVYDNAMAGYLQTLNDERSFLELETASTSTDDIDMESKKSIVYYRYEKYLLPPLPQTVLRLRRDERHRKNLEMLYAHRWRYVLEQLQEGTSILLTDVNNIFNQHVDLSSNSDFSNYDVLHSYEGQEIPEQVHEQIGITVHAGMMWLQANPSTVKFVQKLVDRCQSMCNDQIILNEMIVDHSALGIEWDEISEENVENSDYTKSRTGRAAVTGHTVKVWDSSWVYRGLECPDNPWITMPLVDTDSREFKMPSSYEKKIEILEAWDNKCGKRTTKAYTL